MATRIIRLLTFIICFPASALTLERPAQVLVDQSAPQRALVLLENGASFWHQDGSLKASTIFNTIDSRCLRPTQAFETIQLVYPYIVGLRRVCLIDEAARAVRLIEEGSVPENSFAIVYFGADAGSLYFLMNGHPYDGEGFLKLRVVDRQTGRAELRDLITAVPGFSAAMWSDSKDTLVTTWERTNQIYKLSQNTLWTLIHERKAASFAQVATPWLAPFNGLSLTVAVGPSAVLYFNPGYESYTVDRENGQVQVAHVPEGCGVVGPARTGWLLLCAEGRELKTSNLAGEVSAE